MSQDRLTVPAPLLRTPSNSFFHYAATLSVWLILPPFVIQFLTASIFQAMDRNLVEVVVRLVSAFLIMGSMLLGVISGIVALCGIPKYGYKGILIKALCGILVPILLILVSLPSAIRAAEIASRMRAQQEAR